MKAKIKARFYSLKRPLLFFSLHKSGSSLMGSHLLSHAIGAKYVDLDRLVVEQVLSRREKEYFWRDLSNRGNVIGPIRINTYDTSQDMMEYRIAVTSSSLIKRFRVAVMVRDPRDILVSSYYSFKGSHVLSPNPTIRKSQEEFRKKLLEMDLADFVEFYLPNLKSTMQEMVRICEVSSKLIVLKYEDLVDNWVKFKNNIEDVICVSAQVMDKLYLDSRPREAPCPENHKRSGKTGQYLREMDSETIKRVNVALDESLKYFCYEI